MVAVTATHPQSESSACVSTPGLDMHPESPIAGNYYLTAFLGQDSPKISDLEGRIMSLAQAASGLKAVEG